MIVETENVVIKENGQEKISIIPKVDGIESSPPKESLTI